MPPPLTSSHSGASWSIQGGRWPLVPGASSGSSCHPCAAGQVSLWTAGRCSLGFLHPESPLLVLCPPALQPLWPDLGPLPPAFGHLPVPPRSLIYEHRPEAHQASNRLLWLGSPSHPTMSWSPHRAGREAQVKVGISRKAGGGQVRRDDPAAGFLALVSSQLVHHLAAGNTHFPFPCIFSSFLTKTSPEL